MLNMSLWHMLIFGKYIDPRTFLLKGVVSYLNVRLSCTYKLDILSILRVSIVVPQSDHGLQGRSKLCDWPKYLVKYKSQLFTFSESIRPILQRVWPNLAWLPTLAQPEASVVLQYWHLLKKQLTWAWAAPSHCIATKTTCHQSGFFTQSIATKTTTRSSIVVWALDKM